MLKRILILSLVLFALHSSAQNYNNFLNYTSSVVPTNGIKIRTKIPFLTSVAMPTIMINGYSYGSNEPIGLSLTFYVFHAGSDYTNPNTYYFHQTALSSSGAYTPVIKLSAEDGMVVIFIDDKNYYQRFTVSAYATGVGESPLWFQGWTTVDEPVAGTQITEVPYVNRFKGIVNLPGSGIWDKEGNVGIGTQLPKEKLSVNGKIRAHEIKVETANWPDFVFEKSYALPTLQETASFIEKNGHLPDVPSAAEVQHNGVELGTLGATLLQKIEEMTLHMIDLKKENDQLKKDNDQIRKEFGLLKSIVLKK